MSYALSEWESTVELPIGYYGDDRSQQPSRLVTLRKMTGKEEALLSEPRLQGNGGKLVTALLASCITEIDGIATINESVLQNMYSVDRNFLLLKLRRLTFGDSMQARYQCPECLFINNAVEDLSQLEIRKLETGGLNISITLKDGYKDPDGNWQYELVFDLPKGIDEEVAASSRDKNPVRQGDVLLARCLQRVGDMDERRVNLLGTLIFSELSLADRKLIEKKLEENTPGTDLTRHIVCDQCGAEFIATLDMTNFFSLE